MSNDTPKISPPAKSALNADLKIAISPKLKNGNDAEMAQQLEELFDGAHNGMRRIVALGVFAHQLKETGLKRGQFGAWLLANKPRLASVHSVTGRPQPSRALSGYMDLVSGVVEGIGFKSMGKFLGEIGKFKDASLAGGKFLLLADAKVPEEVKPLREKILNLVDGKTQKALFTEFKQAEEDEDGGKKKKRGQLKGSKGLTKEMREKAALRAEEERVNELEEEMKEQTKWLYDIADAAAQSGINQRIADKLAEACETFFGFNKRNRDAQKGGAK